MADEDRSGEHGILPDHFEGALSGEQVRRSVISGRLGLAPILDWGKPGSAIPKERSGQFGPSSVDLRLGCYFRTPKDSALAVIDPTGRLGKAGRATEGEFDLLVRCGYGKPFVLHPGRFALAYTLEYLAVPGDLMGYVVGRSSWGRLGLIIATATMVNPGFKGVITLELANVGTLPMAMYPTMRIAQLVLHPVNGEGQDVSDEKYSGQLPGAPQRLYLDRDIPWVAPRSANRIVGIVGPSGSGKSLLTQILVESGYRHYSLAEVVRAEARQRGLRLDIDTLQDHGDEIRKAKGTDWIAREIGRHIREAGDTAQRIVVSGFKHPDELKFFSRDPAFRLVAIEADFRTCRSFREAEVRPESLSPEEDTSFHRSWHRDYDSGVSHGQNVKRCLELADPEYVIHKSANENLQAFKSAFARVLTRIEALESRL